MTKMPDNELTKLVCDWWNKASADDRRRSIYYTQTDIDDYSWVYFVKFFLKLPGFSVNNYDADQADYCAHICCDILSKLTEPLFNKPL